MSLYLRICMLIQHPYSHGKEADEVQLVQVYSILPSCATTTSNNTSLCLINIIIITGPEGWPRTVGRDH